MRQDKRLERSNHSNVLYNNRIQKAVLEAKRQANSHQQPSMYWIHLFIHNKLLIPYDKFIRRFTR